MPSNKFRVSRIITAAIILLLTNACSSDVPDLPENTLITPEGWYFSSYNTKIKYLSAKEEEKQYSLIIDRKLQNEESEHYLRVSESIFPDQNKMFTEENQQVQQWYFERSWWNETKDDVPIPFALTADSLNYFIGRYKTLKKYIKSGNQPEKYEETPLQKIELSYRAVVNDEGEILVDGIYYPKTRVRLSMKWYEFCDQPCGWGFEKQRDIIFAGKYRIIGITGDGPTKIWKSSKKKPFGPGQWIRF